jgi:hypothetical protein
MIPRRWGCKQIDAPACTDVERPACVLTMICTKHMLRDMNGERRPAIRRVTANLPAKLLRAACQSAGKGITETIVEGLELVRRAGALEKARRLRGRLRLEIDLETSRERARH